MTVVTYLRAGGGHARVPEHEWLEVDGRAFRAWRQVGTDAVGSFVGDLTAAELDRLHPVITALDGAAPPEPRPGRPDASTVTLTLDGAIVTYGAGNPPDGAWGELAEVMEGLLAAVHDRPSAAVGIVGSEGGAMLERRGNDPLTVGLGTGQYVAIAWEGWYHEVARDSGPIPVEDHEGQFVTDSSWRLFLPVDLAAPDAIVHVTVEFDVIVEGREPVRVELSHAPPLPRPDA